jgi:hypothetical protein
MLPRWLDPTTYGLLILGTVAFLIGMVLLFWPRRHREIVYVVEPSQVPEIAARLGISTEPLAAALGGTADPFDVVGGAPETAPPAPPEPVPAAPAGPGAPLVEPPAWLVDPNRVVAPPAPVSPPVAYLMGGGVVMAPPAGAPAAPPAPPAWQDHGFPADRAVALAHPSRNGDLAASGASGGATAGPGVPIWAGPTPLPVATGQPGMYRSFTAAPPPITPSFVWPPVPE